MVSSCPLLLCLFGGHSWLGLVPRLTTDFVFMAPERLEGICGVPGIELRWTAGKASAIPTVLSLHPLLLSFDSSSLPSRGVQIIKTNPGARSWS